MERFQNIGKLNHYIVYIKKNKLKNKGNVITNVLSLSYGKIKRRDVESNFGLLPDSFETYQIIQKDDIVLRLTDLQNDKRSLRVGLVNEEGIITSAYLGLKQSNKSISVYTYYLLHSYDLKKVFYGLGSGVRQSMGFTEMKKLPILLPPLEEQFEIINQLKVKVLANEQLIDMLKTQIKKLKEYRQSLIYEAVTGKIDVRDMQLDKVR
ncbi:restriction endonuclease subunit S [Bacillus sp. SIMBA_161]